MKKNLWLRLGVTIMCDESDMAVISKGGVAAKNLIRNKVELSQFTLDGETYVPARDACSDSEWPVSEDIEILF